MKVFQGKLNRVKHGLILSLFVLTGVLTMGCEGDGGNGDSALPYQPAYQPIAVWAFPDSATVTGSINVGVVAYHSKGIESVDFQVDNVPVISVTDEDINSDTGEGEYYIPIDTTTLANGRHTINAVVTPNGSGSNNELEALTIIVANGVTYNTWYVDCNAANDNGDGSAGNPWKTLGRALGTEWTTRDLIHAENGDTVLLVNGACNYPLPEGRYGELTQYVTIKPDTGTRNRTVLGGVIRSPFMKFEGLNIIGDPSGMVIYRHHIWVKDIYYNGKGQIYPDTINYDEAIRSVSTSDRDFISYDVIVEDSLVENANQGISMIGDKNHIIRNNTVRYQNGDAMKFQGDNVLISGNTIHDVMPPVAWSVSRNPGTYDCSSGCNLIFNISDNKGSSYSESFAVTISGNSLTADDVVNQLNANATFIDSTRPFLAEVSTSPYPYVGNVKISLNLHNENYYFYIAGTGESTFEFTDNSYWDYTGSIGQNDISEIYPAKHTSDHCDFIANDARDANNIIIRNNKMTQGEVQGIKLDAIGNSSRQDYYKEHIAIINNLLAANDRSARLLYFDYRGSGNPRSIFHYNNILLAHNTIMKPAIGRVRTNISLDLLNPNLSYIYIKNNIIGDYFTGDWPLADTEKPGDMDYNLFTDNTHASGYPMNSNSLLGNPSFVNLDYNTNWDLSVNSDSDAKLKADPSVGVKYDLEWTLRNTTAPTIGAYEAP